MKSHSATMGGKVLIAAGYLLLYLAAEAAAISHGDGAALYQPWHPGPALSLALLTRLGLAWLPLALLAPLAALLSPLAVPMDPAWALLRAGVEAVACAGAAMLMRLPGGTAPELSRPGAVASFVATVLAASLAISMVRGVEASAAIGGWAALGVIFRTFLAVTVAMLALAPLVLTLRRPRTRPKPWITVESVLQAGALAAITWEVFTRFVNAEIHFFYLLFLPVAWIASRHGQAGVVAALGTVYLAPMVSDWWLSHQGQAIVELQIRIIVLAVTGLLLGAMVSERKRAEQRMLDRQAELAHFQRLNVGWEMASALAHELTQPLTAAMNYTQAAQRLIAQPQPDLERAARVMARSVDQIERAGQTIHGLRDFMRKGELRLARTDLAGVVDDALLLVAGEANAAGISLHSAGLAGLPPVMADKTQIVQVMINLVRNAIQTLAASGREDGRVAVSGRLDGDHVEVAVADNGPGLSPKVLAHLFEPFVTTKEAGMGLGLSISKSILEIHEGSLTAGNAPGGGAVFRFTLPLAQDGEMADE